MRLALLAAAALALAAPAPALAARLFVSPSGSDSGACTEAAPCRSLDRAYRVAQPGQVVVVRGGTYPDQTIRADGAKTSPRDVVFRAAVGAAVRMNRLVVAGRHLTLERLILRHYWWIEAGAEDVTFRNVRTGVFVVRSSRRISILGGQVGPWDSNRLAPVEDSQIGEWDSSLPQPAGILIDGVFFHDFTRRFDPEAHTDCLQFTGGIGVTIRNSRFRRCATTDVFVKGDFGPIRDFLIENDRFGRTLEGYHSLRLGSPGARPCENVLVRNNSALQKMWSNCEAGGARGIRFLGNIMDDQDDYDCSESTRYGAVWAYNVYGSGVTCGAHDLVAPTGFRDPARFDLRLRPGAAAIDHGDPESFSRYDFQHERRPKGPRPDAGADEAG